jgi:peptide/nickel transport system ATP-binding protein
MPSGCRFAPRCPFAEPSCTELVPPERVMSATHRVACFAAPVDGVTGRERVEATA